MSGMHRPRRDAAGRPVHEDDPLCSTRRDPRAGRGRLRDVRRAQADRTNAVFVCHALTGDANAAGHHGDEQRPGWWDNLIGPGKPLDTDSLYVVSANLLGGCRGTTGPMSIDPASGKPYGLRFPLFTVADLVGCTGPSSATSASGGCSGRSAARWRHAGAAVGARPPRRPARGGRGLRPARLSAQNIAFSAVARTAILRDEHFAGGDYYGTGPAPTSASPWRG